MTTDLLLVDTDGNGISDADEDFDNDGLTDDEELKLGLNPCNAISDGITPDNARTFIQTADDSVMDDALQNSNSWLSPSISGNVSGDILRNITLEESLINAFDDNHSILSDIIDVSTSYCAPLTLSFSYNIEYTGDDKNLTIVSFDDVSGLHIIDTTVDGLNKTISGDIIGSGTYFVIDLDEFLKGLGIDVFSNIQKEFEPAQMDLNDDLSLL